MERMRLDSYPYFQLLVHMLHLLERPAMSSLKLLYLSPQEALATSSLAQITKTTPSKSFSNTSVTSGTASTTRTVEDSPTLPRKVSGSMSSTRTVALRNLTSSSAGPLLQRLLLPRLLLFSIMPGCRQVCHLLDSLTLGSIARAGTL